MFNFKGCDFIANKKECKLRVMQLNFADLKTTKQQMCKTFGMNDEILNNKTAGILLIENRESQKIVIGAPHHTLGGIKNMPCPEHTDGDENTGFIAQEVAQQLKCSSIIACNYPIDPNKKLSTDYSVQILNWKPQYLIEIHGHGARKLNNQTIEISSGSIARNPDSMLFATVLKTKFLEHEILKNYKICGNFNFIHFKAVKSATITDERWKPFHIELPPSIRLDNENRLPSFINDFNNFLVETIREVCI